MSQPPPQCNKQITSLTNSWSLVAGRVQPLRSEVSPTLSPAKAEELVQKQIEYKEQKDAGRRVTDMSMQWKMPAQYAPSPQNVPAVTRSTTANTANTTNSEETGLSQARFETPPPVHDETLSPLSSLPPMRGQSLDEIASSALQSDALIEATGPTDPFMALLRMSEEYDLMRSWSSVFLIVRCLPPLKGTRGPVGSLRLSCARHGFEMRHPKVSFVCEKVEGQRDSLCRCSVGENTASHWGGVF